MNEHPQWWYMANAVQNEWDRVVAWHGRRHDFWDGSYYSWLEAMWTVAENPPSLDRQWDETAAEGPHPDDVEFAMIEIA